MIPTVTPEGDKPDDDTPDTDDEVIEVEDDIAPVTGPPEESEPEAEVPDADSTRLRRIEVTTDADGNGSAQFGAEPESVERVAAPQGGEARFGPSHTTGITRIDLTGSPTTDGTAVVFITLK